VKQISLTHGFVTLVDDEDYATLVKYRWFARHSGNSLYAQRNERGPEPRGTVHMHRCIIGCPEGMEVDHVNHNGLDNRRSNLRICTKTQNQANRRKGRGTSKYKGVTFRHDRYRWEARIRAKGRLIQLGTFSDERSAALAYDYAAVGHFGAFACTNNPFGTFLGEQT